MRRIQRTPSDPVNMYTPAMSTVSEGIAYGMLIAVYMGTKDDQMLFDDLWRYSQAHLNGNGLMHWGIAANGTTITGQGGATDADEDIAFALVMADKQWGSAGTLNYLNLAKTQITSVWDCTRSSIPSWPGRATAGDRPTCGPTSTSRISRPRSIACSSRSTPPTTGTR